MKSVYGQGKAEQLQFRLMKQRTMDPLSGEVCCMAGIL